MSKFNFNPYKKLLVSAGLILLAAFVLMLVNQAAQMVSMAASIDPLFGKILLYVFLIIGALSLSSIIFLLSRLDKPLSIPDPCDEKSFARYLAKSKQRLMKNKYLKSVGYCWDQSKSDQEEIEEALKVIDEKSRQITKNNAAAVFVTTAVSQNGSLDSIFVFVTAMKLVWQIAVLYNQRPAVRDLGKLYANVMATVLIARQIDDIDLMAEQLEPILSALFGGTVGTIVPGISYVGSFVVDSILEGGLNTMLTLRVGLITQQYCRSTTKLEPRSLGRSATIQACAMLGGIVLENSKRISDALLKAIRNAAASPFIRGKKKFSGVLENLFGRDTVPEK